MVRGVASGLNAGGLSGLLPFLRARVAYVLEYALTGEEELGRGAERVGGGGAEELTYVMGRGVASEWQEQVSLLRPLLRPLLHKYLHN